MDRLTQAVQTCIAHALQSDRPFIRVTQFIAELRSQPEWTHDEIMDVQTKVIRALIRELRLSSKLLREEDQEGAG